MKLFNLFCILSIIVLFSCNSASEELKEVPEPKVEKIKETVIYNKLPVNYANKIYTEADALEGTFYESGKSVSLWEDNVKSILTMMSEPAPISLESKLVGHIMFLKQGESLAFVEIYLSPNNNFVKFKVNEEIYYNKVSEQGVKFLGQMATAPPLVEGE